MEYDKVAHIIEVVGKSSRSWEDAVKNAVKHVYKKHKDICCVDVVKNTANIGNGKIIEYKTDVKLAVIG